jgi:hypothetical protein
MGKPTLLTMMTVGMAYKDYLLGYKYPVEFWEWCVEAADQKLTKNEIDMHIRASVRSFTSRSRTEFVLTMRWGLRFLIPSTGLAGSSAATSLRRGR